MTDQELAIALYAEGLRPSEIAEKLEVTTHQVKVWLGVTGGRPPKVNAAVMSVIGDEKMTALQIAKATGINPRNMAVYITRLIKSGSIVREQCQINNRNIWLYRRA